MTVPPFENIVKTASAALVDWNSFVEILYAIDGPGGAIFYPEIQVSGAANPTTIEQLGGKLAGASGLVRDFARIESADLIPDQVIIDLTARASAVRSAVEKLLAQVVAFDPESKVTSLDPPNISATNEAGQQVNLLPAIIEVYANLQNFLTSIYQMRSVAGVSGTDGFAVELAQLAAARSAQRKSYADIGRLKKALQSNAQKMNEVVASADATVQKIAAAEKSVNEGAQRVEGAKAQYTYKYTVAASLPGFKLEAPTYAEAITASAFKELLFNPAESVGLPEEANKEGNTFLQRLIEPAVKRILDKMGEVPKNPVVFDRAGRA